VHEEELEALIGRLPRVRLAFLPTPLQDCPQLSKSLGGVRILAKRDDLSGLAFGGNKNRALEFIVGKALQAKSDTLITWSLASAPANHCRLTAAAAARTSLNCVIVLGGRGFSSSLANAFLSELVGAELRFVPTEESERLRFECQQLVNDLRAEGRRPYLVDVDYFYGGYGALGYAECAVELRRQLRALGARADYVYTCSQGGTQAGLVLGKALLKAQFEVVGIASMPPRSDLKSAIASWAEDAARLLGLEVPVAETEISNYAEFVGERSRTVNSGCLEAIRLVARTEGIILDPVHTGKAMAGLISHIRCGRINAKETVVFVHTGGTPVIFDYVDAREFTHRALAHTDGELQRR
jgi:1-aminocyclopropane-1-carboxylate deaminase/D-cysteine desulfhydrase-like pyridoxal-dependent ACC family enzyme